MEPTARREPSRLRKVRTFLWVAATQWWRQQPIVQLYWTYRVLRLLRQLEEMQRKQRLLRRDPLDGLILRIGLQKHRRIGDPTKEN